MNLISDLHHKVFIATAVDELGKKYGFVITWITPASLNEKEPRILMVVSKFNHTLKVMQKSNKCCLNLLSKSQLKEFVMFGSKHSDEIDKFAGVDHQLTLHGIILNQSLGHAEIEIEQWFETSDRYLVYGKVVSQEVKQGSPLLLEQALHLIDEQDKKALTHKMAQDVLRDEKQFTTYSR